MSARGKAAFEGPWPEKKTPRERLAAESERLRVKWAGQIESGAPLEAMAQEARNRLIQPLQQVASSGDAMALEEFARGELGSALLGRADMAWAVRACERAGPQAREALAKHWIEPRALAPANSEGERWPAEGALRCLAAIVARMGPGEEGALAACERALARAFSGLQDPAAAMMGAGALSMSLPKVHPRVFGRLCGWLLAHCPEKAAAGSATLLSQWVADAFAGRHGERDAAGMARVGECAQELLSGVLRELGSAGEGAKRALSPGQAWLFCERIFRMPGVGGGLAEMESRFAPGGFRLSDEEMEDLKEDWQGEAKLFWGQLWGNQEPGRGERLSLPSVALFVGDLPRARELIERGCWWGEEEFFKMARAFERQEGSGELNSKAPPRQMELLRRSVALGEALALELQEPGGPARRSARSI